MATKLSSSLSFSIIIIVIIIIATQFPPTSGFAVELIHRNSLLHPSNITIPPLDRLIAKSPHALSRSLSLSASTIVSPVTPHNADHLMRFSVGTPPVPVLAVMDTGSDLTWLRCLPCSDCLPGKLHLFNPSLSLTYRPLLSSSAKCKQFDPDETATDSISFCSYKYSYGDGSFSSGVLSTETFTFESTSGESIAVPRITFGCGYNNSPSFDGELFGLAGLGGMSFSLVSQLGPEAGKGFSYCLSPFRDNASTSFMRFGDEAVVSGEKTPLVSKADKTFYFVTLEAVSVRGKKVDVATTREGKGNMFIDSGTTVTLVDGDVFEELGDLVAAAVGLPWKMDAGNTFKCYEAGRRDVFPDIVFHFAGGAEVVLKPLNAFTEPSEEGLVCLAMQATNGTGIFGNMAQQNLHVGFDLAGRKVAFAAADCSHFGR